MTTKKFHPETLSVRAGSEATPFGENSEALFLNSSFRFENAAQAAARFGGTEPGNIYSRFTNPTVRTFEQRLASLEGGERCVATSSGMAAILTTCMGLLKSGDHIAASRSIFGPTVILFNSILARFGVQTTFVPLTDLKAWEQAIKPNTRLLFLETPSNPLSEIADIKALSGIAHRHGCLLVVDNCFLTPALQQPLKLGADIVVHSASKYIDGQGRAVGGAVVGSQQLVGGEIYNFLRTAGPSMSPFNAWIYLKGLETLRLRMEAHGKNALALAAWLEQQPAVARVHYPGLKSHPQHALATRQQSGFGGVLAFEVKGGREAAWKVIDATRIISITATFGDTKSTITHPATTTHWRLTPEARLEAGITDGLIRIGVGLEDIEDLKSDLARGLDASRV